MLLCANNGYKESPPFPPPGSESLNKGQKITLALLFNGWIVMSETHKGRGRGRQPRTSWTLEVGDVLVETRSEEPPLETQAANVSRAHAPSLTSPPPSSGSCPCEEWGGVAGGTLKNEISETACFFLLAKNFSHFPTKRATELA